jgi:hypothetical protein
VGDPFYRLAELVDAMDLKSISVLECWFDSNSGQRGGVMVTHRAHDPKLEVQFLPPSQAPRSVITLINCSLLANQAILNIYYKFFYL